MLSELRPPETHTIAYLLHDLLPCSGTGAHTYTPVSASPLSDLRLAADDPRLLAGPLRFH